MHLESKILNFHSIKALYIEDEDFKMVEDSSLFDFVTLQEDILPKENKPCFPKRPIRDLIVKEAYGGALINHFGINENLKILNEYFISPRWVAMSTR